MCACHAMVASHFPWPVRACVSQAELAAFAPRPDRNAVGLVVCNPPYGKRLGDAESLVYLYRGLGQRLKAECCGWRAAVFTGNPELGKRMGLRARKLYSFLNGTIPCQLLMFDVTEEWFVQSAGPRPAAPKPSVAEIEPGPGAEMFANRLKKNLRRLGKWARKHGIECYRLYDADMPEYALAIDCYGDWLHVQEYAPPSSIDPEKAASRLAEALAVIPRVLNLTPDRVVFKQRKRQRGRSQYEARDRRGEFIEVGEGSCRLLVNLTDYLDTGLFLDHRPLRRLIGEEAKGLRFLNLFCYTATATVHAVLGGAASSVSVDTSATYLGWARRNLSLNGLSEVHELVQRDCREFLAQEAGRFDLIFLDPPTFSNTKRADRESFDLQRDHVGLIRAAAARLDRNGVLYFSNNYRRFKMDLESLSAELVLDNITPATIDRDFERNPRIHNCWKIQRNDDV